MPRRRIAADVRTRVLRTWLAWSCILVMLLIYSLTFSMRWVLLPHRFCIIDNPWIIWPMSIANTAIALCYFLIPSVMLNVLWRVPVAHFSPRLVYWFASFIATCGLTHVMLVLTIWWPVYYPQMAVDVICAVCSFGTLLEFDRARPAFVKFVDELMEGKIALDFLRGAIDRAEALRRIAGLKEQPLGA